jgi:hypothetical protein
MFRERIAVADLGQGMSEATLRHELDGHLMIENYVIRHRARHQSDVMRFWRFLQIATIIRPASISLSLYIWAALLFSQRAS